MNQKIIFSLLTLTIIISSISVASAQTKSNTCEDGMMYDSNTDSCILDTYKHIRDSIIPNWIKQTAVWWGQGMVTDDEFLGALQYLIGEGLLQIPSDKINSTTIDESIKTNNEVEPFVINIIKCTSNEYGFIDLDFSVKNNLDKNYTLDLSLLLIDSSGNVLDVVEHYTDTNSGGIVYDERSFPYQSGASGCEINIDKVIE